MIYIVLPAYNEQQALPPLLDEIGASFEESRLPYKILIVNDGSTDGTEKIISAASMRLPIILISHPSNKGLAEALKTGLLAAVQYATGNDVIVTMDSDNTHTPDLIMRMVRMIREGYDVVIASRYAKGGKVIGVPFFRRILSFGSSIIFRTLFPIRGVKDYTSGYRAYRAKVMKDMFASYGDVFIDEPGFTCMVDILLKMRKYTLIIGETPLLLRYDKKEGASKMNVAKTIRQTLKLILKRRFSRI